MLLGFAKGLVWPWAVPPLKLARWALVTAATGVKESWAYVNKPVPPRPATPWDGKFTTHEEKTLWGQRWKIRYPSNLKPYSDTQTFELLAGEKDSDQGGIMDSRRATGRAVRVEFGLLEPDQKASESLEAWRQSVSDGVIQLWGYQPGSFDAIKTVVSHGPDLTALDFLHIKWNDERLRKEESDADYGKDLEERMLGFRELSHGWQLVPGMSQEDAVFRRFSSENQIKGNYTSIEMALRVVIGGDSPGYSYWYVTGLWMTDVGPAVPIRIEEAVRSFVVDRVE